MPKILELGELLKSKRDPRVTLDAEHYFIEGVYVRSLFIPAGTVLVGKIHNKETISILTKGTLQVTNGDAIKVVTAGHIVVEQPGVKRAGYALTDCIFVNIFKDEEGLKDMDDSERLGVLASDSFEEFGVRRLS